MFFIKLICILHLSITVSSFYTTNEAYGAEKKRAVLNVTEKKKKRKKTRTPPQLRKSAVFALQVERKLIKGIDKTIKYLQKTASNLPRRSAQRLQLLERVLNLHMEQAAYVRNEEERSYDSRWRVWEENKKGREPRLSTKRSDGHWRSVIKQATAILNEYPRSKSADVVTFDKAVGLQYLRKEKAAARIYSQLIQRYPNSNVAGEAYASLGDYFFDRNDFRNAESNYKKAIKYRRSKRYLWSVFKLGWCSYNLGRYKTSLEYWKKLVRQSRSQGKSGAQLRDEALRDMVYAFAELRDIDGAIAYYRANGGGKYIGPFLMLLSEILSDQGHYKSAIGVLKRYQRVSPYSAEGPQAQKEIINLYYALSKMNMVWRELARFAPIYGPRSAWSRRNKKESPETQAMIKEQILYYSTLTHQKAIKDNNRAMNLEARKGYLLFLKSYPKDKEVAGVKYLLADIAYYLKNYKEAGRYYLEIAEMGKKKAIRVNPKTGKSTNIHRESAVDMVRSYVTDFQQEFKVLKKRKPNFKKPKPLSPRAKNYVMACTKYKKWYPKDAKRTKSCDTGIANVYYYSGHKKQSVKHLKYIAFRYSKVKEGAASVSLLIPLIKNDKQELMKLTGNLLRIPAYKKGKMGSQLRSLQRGSEKEAIARESDSYKRAKKYEAQARKYPKDADVDKLWYNAAVDYIKAGAVTDALRAYSVIVTKYPKTQQAKMSLMQIARIYEKQLLYVKASTYFALYAKKYPKEKDAPGAMSRSCELLLAMDSDSSLSVCTSFARKYPDASSGFINQLIVNQERSHQYKKMINLIKKFYLSSYKLSANDQIVSLNRIYKAYKGKGAEAQKAANQILKIFQNNRNTVTGEALRYVGRLVFKKTPPAFEKFRKTKLQGGTVEKLLQSIQNKAALLAQLEQIYGQVLQTKDAYWGVAAFYQLGLANELYAKDLENPPRIKGAALEDVKKELAPQVNERKKIALARYKDAYDTVSKFKIYNDWSVKVVNAMYRVKGSNLVFEDSVVTPDFLQTQIPSNLASSLRGGK